jgi:ribonucleoside-triphosphate reductase
MAKMFLDQAGLQYEVVVAEDSPELCKEYEIKEAPTLVVVNEEGFEKIANPSNIKAFTEKVAASIN